MSWTIHVITQLWRNWRQEDYDPYLSTPGAHRKNLLAGYKTWLFVMGFSCGMLTMAVLKVVIS